MSNYALEGASHKVMGKTSKNSVHVFLIRLGFFRVEGHTYKMCLALNPLDEKRTSTWSCELTAGHDGPHATFYSPVPWGQVVIDPERVAWVWENEE